MPKPAIVDLVHGLQGWDTVLNDNHAILRDGPLPIKEYANEAALPATGAVDRCLALVNGPNGWSIYLNDGTQWLLIQRANAGSTHGQRTEFLHVEAVSGALPAAATYTFVNLIPAGCILIGVDIRVLTTITGPASLDIGDGTTATQFGSTVALVAGTTSDLPDHAAASVPKLYKAANNVVLTAHGGTGAFTGGNVRATSHYMKLTPATS